MYTYMNEERALILLFASTIIIMKSLTYFSHRIHLFLEQSIKFYLRNIETLRKYSVDIVIEYFI